MVPMAREPALWDAVAVVAEAYDLFGDWETVCFWLLKRNRMLENARPAELLDDPAGCEKILALLARVTEGTCT